MSMSIMVFSMKQRKSGDILIRYHDVRTGLVIYGILPSGSDGLNS